MDTLKAKLTSRKFLLTIGAILIALGGYLSGTLDANAAILAIVGAVGSYAVGEGIADMNSHQLPNNTTVVMPPSAIQYPTGTIGVVTEREPEPAPEPQPTPPEPQPEPAPVPTTSAAQRRSRGPATDPTGDTTRL